MVELHLIYALLNATTAVMAIAVTGIAWRRRSARLAAPLAALMFGIAVWSGCAAVMWYVPGPGDQLLWLKVGFLGVCVVPIAVMALALDAARIRRWRTEIIASLAVVSSAFVATSWINPGRLYDAAFVVRTMGTHTYYDVIPGSFYIAYNVFAYATCIAGLLMMLWAWQRFVGADRSQVGILFVGGLLPLAASAVTELRVLPLGGLDLAPLAFLITGTFWLHAVFRGTLLGLLPVGRGALVEKMSDGVILLDAADRVVDVNPAALALLRTSTAEVLGKPAETALEGLEGAAALLRGSGPRSDILSTTAADDPRQIDLAIAPLVVGVRGTRGSLLTLHDVTFERRSREHLELARTVFDTANEGIVVTESDTNATIIDANDAFCDLIGRSRGDTIGKDLAFVRSDRHPPEFHLAMQQEILATGTWKGEVWQKRADGSEFLSWLSVVVAKDHEGNAGHVVEFIKDITPVRAALDAKSRFLSNMSHELRTPLNSIIGFTGVLEQGLAGPLTDEQRTQLAMIHRSGKDLLTFVNEVLDLEGIEAGRATVVPARFDLCVLARVVAGALASQAEAKGIRVRAVCLSEPLEIVSDRAKVERVLINIVDNAVRFTDSGEVTIECRAERPGVAVAVSDTGIGIPAEDIDRVMDDFHQVDGADGLKPSGAGTGLPISRLLLGLLGGRLEVESELGSGSTFTVWLPERIDARAGGSV